MSGTAVEVAARRSPYQGLVPYTEADADWFFGREEWREIVRSNLLAYRITVLYGASGVGKSSLLRAGLVRTLRDESGAARDAFLPVYFAAWSLDDPLSALRDAVHRAAAELGHDAGESDRGPLADALAAWPGRVGGPVLLVLDQLEELFAYHDRPGDTTLRDLTAALRRRDPAVHFLLSIREDSLARLDRFEGRVPGLLEHLLRLEHLERDAARTAIVAPLERWNERVAAPGEELEPPEEALVDAVLDQVEAGKVGLGERATGAGGEAATGVEAPYLQLVLERLWEEEQREGSRRLRLQTFDRLGGATVIVRTHLDAALAALPERDQEVAGRTFPYLVTPSGAKIAHRLEDLATYTGATEAQLRPLVDELAGEVRILRPAGDGRYEIYHDALAGPILDWCGRWDERRKRRRERRRLGLVGGIALALAGIAVAIAILAVQARNAQHAARVGQSQALAEQALAKVDGDPVAALGLAVRAAKAWSTAEAESALRVSIASDLLRATLRGHTDHVWSVTFSRDGRYLLTAGADGTARIWDASNGRSLHTLSTGRPLSSQEFEDSSAAFSPNGKLVVTAGGAQARIWDAATGRSLRALASDGFAVFDASFSPDGKRVVVAYGNGTAKIWDVASGRSLRTLPASRSAIVFSAAFSPDGKLVATGGEDRTARIWDAASGSLLHTLVGHTDYVYSAAFSPDNRFVVTASGDHTARIWDAASGARLRTLTGHTDRVFGAAFSPDGKLVVTAGGDGTARIWDVATGHTVQTLTVHIDRVYAAAFSPDGKRVVTVGADGTARIWAVAATAQLVHSLGRPGKVTSAALSPDGRLVITAAEDGTARIWDVATGSRVRTLAGHAYSVESNAFSPDGKLVVARSDGGTARIWQVATGRPVKTLASQGHPAVSAAFSPDGRLAVVAADDGTARVWDVASGGPLGGRQQTLGFGTTPPFNPDGTLMVTGSYDGTADIRSAASGRSFHTLGIPSPSQQPTSRVTSAAFSPDGRLVVTGNVDRTAQIWDVATGRSLMTLRGHTSGVSTVGFSPDGKLVVASSGDGTTRVWDVATGQSLDTLGGQIASGGAFAGDGTLVVTFGGDGTARVWDTASGDSLDSLGGLTDKIEMAALSPDGTRVVTVDADGTARIWTCDVCGSPDAALLALGKKRLAAP